MFGNRLVQWVDVDALWLHQPWRVDEHTRSMVEANLRCVTANAEAAGVDTLVVTWVFQSAEMQALVQGLAPDGADIVRVQLIADETSWRSRFESDTDRPPINDFYVDRYWAAQQTPADHQIDVSTHSPAEVAEVLVDVLGLASP